LLFNRMNPKLLVSVVALSILLSSCAMGPTKEEVAAEQARIEKIEADKRAAVKQKKLAAEKQAAEAEDAIQMQDIDVVVSPKSEKISKTPGIISTAVAQPEVALDIPTAPDTYLITRTQKDKTHPFFGVGDPRGFVVNGVQGTYVIARRNHPVTFQVRTGPMHDFYISTTPKGWGGGTYREGVSGQFTYNGNVTITANMNTPDTLYYACRNHNSMGGKIVVVDENADLMAVKQQQDAELAAQLAKLQDIVVPTGVDPKKLKQKIAYVGMLLQFKGKQLPAGQLALVEKKLASSKSLQASGDLTAAMVSAQAAADLFNEKSSEVKLSDEELADQKEEFNDLLVTLEAFIDAHLASYRQAKEEGRKTVSYDSNAVGSYVVEAKGLAEEQKYPAAGKSIKNAERMVTRALNEMLNAQTIVYDLNFKTPDEEFKYEVNRYKGYAELIPVAIEVKKPKASAIEYAKTFQEKSEFYKTKAEEAADAEQWEEALVVIKDATMEVRRALRVLGVSM